MKIYSIFIVFSLGITVISACRQNKDVIKQIKVQGLTLMVMKTPGGPEDADEMTYSARLIPDKGLIENKNAVVTAMQYKMDSCFYLQQGKERIYASLTQPIANGVKDSFEYLLSFERQGIKNNKWDFVYLDKYLNHKIYKIAIGQE